MVSCRDFDTYPTFGTHHRWTHLPPLLCLHKGVGLMLLALLYGSRRPRNNTQKLLIGLKSRADAPKTWEKKSNKTTTPIRDNVDEEIECLHDIKRCQNPKAKDASRRPPSLADRWNLKKNYNIWEGKKKKSICKDQRCHDTRDLHLKEPNHVSFVHDNYGGNFGSEFVWGGSWHRELKLNAQRTIENWK